MEVAMRGIMALAVFGLAFGAPAALQAQGAPPPGSYQRDCRNISMDGPYLHAWCRGSRGSGQSTLNVQSCSSDIGVDPDGGLICSGGGGQPNYPIQDRPNYDRPNYDRPNYDRPGYDRPPYDNRPYPGDRPSYDDDRYRPPYGGGGNSREPVATLYEGRGFRGQSIEVYGETSNLNRTGFNDRVGSIRFSRRSGPWQVCTDSKFRGRCVVVRGEVRDAHSIGMGDAISSLRPY
jgi:hypothetical protein